MTVTHPYFPLVPGSWTEYRVEAFTGTWDDLSMVLVVQTVTQVPAHGYQRITCIRSGDFVGLVNPGSAQTVTAIIPGATLFEDYHPDGIGEAVNQSGWVQEPPILILPSALATGQSKSYVSKITGANSAGIISRNTFNYRAGVIMRGRYGAYADCIRTGLREMPELPNSQVYNYVFARDVGLVSFWFGTLAPGGKVINGYVFSIQRTGNNP